MKKLIIANIVIAALVFLFIKANINVSEKYSDLNQEQNTETKGHFAAK